MAVESLTKDLVEMLCSKMQQEQREKYGTDSVSKYDLMDDAVIDSPEWFKPFMRHTVDLAIDELVIEKRLE